MQIDVSNAAKFGSLTLGGGLATAFDKNGGTTAYTDSTTGFVGVSIPEPKRIDRVEAVSATNGFDASGLTTSITLQLYGKKGAAPVSATDGVVIGVASFTDQNVRRAVTLQSNDKVTLFDHIWIRLSTGVWSVVAELRLFEAPEPEPIPEPETLASGSHSFRRSCNELVPLTSAGSEVHQFRTAFYIPEARKVLLDFNVAVIHTGEGADANVPVGYSFWICRRSSPTLEGLRAAGFVNLPNMFNGDNVANRNPQHYGTIGIVDTETLEPGFHEYSIIANGHTDGSTTQGILKISVEAGMGLNCLRVVVLP